MSAGAGYYWIERTEAFPDEVENALTLRNLPPNRWVKYHEERPGAWSRQGHAGIAFDTRRGSLLIFGSDTHGENWDNSVHEFQPLRRRWETHYPEADPATYRADETGRAIAGTDRLAPWAMHTYDTVEYHPKLDALVVASDPQHTPYRRPGLVVKERPTWLYDLKTRRWAPFPNNGKPTPIFFGGASAFDERRQVLVAYKHRLWEMDLDAGEWRQASPEGHHGMHQTMVYDSRRHALFVFGNYEGTKEVWRYTPGPRAGERGTWQLLRPEGDVCPPYSSAPVAFDRQHGVFLLVVDGRDPSGRNRASTASTYVFDPDANSYTKLPEADLTAVGMNYMMAWDRNLGVFFLVTGQDAAVTVWALRLRR